MGGHYQTEEQIAAVIQGFESCTLGKDEFNHREHLTVAVWYLRNSNPSQALERMRSGLLRFLDHHGVGRAKYKETLTASWLKLIQSAMEKISADLSLLEITNIVIERLGDSRLVCENSDEVAASDIEEKRANADVPHRPTPRQYS
jgi:hypothetical protein